jgi:hypothetical protein
LIVRMDPRVKASAADLKTQYDASRSLDAALRRVNDALAAKRGSQETLSRVQGQLIQLFALVEGSDAAPTTQAMTAVKDTLAAADAALRP